MIDMALDVLSWATILAGCAFSLIGAIGMLRLPDVYTRMHAAGMTDTLGVGLILLGLMLQAGWTLITVKLLLIIVFLFFTSPTAAHALAHAAFLGGVRPVTAKTATAKPEGDDPSRT